MMSAIQSLCAVGAPEHGMKYKEQLSQTHASHIHMQVGIRMESHWGGTWPRLGSCCSSHVSMHKHLFANNPKDLCVFPVGTPHELLEKSR